MISSVYQRTRHTKFYMEYQERKVTDSVRKLTKLECLRLWKGRPCVIMPATVDCSVYVLQRR